MKESILKHLRVNLIEGYIIIQIITQTSPCNILRYFMAVKMVIFRRNKCDIFLIFAQNIDREYVLEPPH